MNPADAGPQQPPHVALNTQGWRLAQSGDIAGGLIKFDAAIALRPTYANAWVNRAAAATRLNRLSEAYDAYVRAVTLTPNFEEALEGIRRLGAMTGRPQIVTTPWPLQATIGEKSDPIPEGLDESGLRSCLALTPENISALVALSRFLFDERRFLEAELFCRYALVLAPGAEEAAFTLCLVLEAADRMAQVKPVAVDAVAAGARGDRLIPFTLWNDLAVTQWSDYDRLLRESVKQLENSASRVAPFTALHLTDDLKLHQISAASFCTAMSAKAVSVHQPPRAMQRSKLRIGYISADFRDHAVARLCAELFELHDRSRFEVYGYAITATGTTAIANRIRDAFDRMLGLDRTPALVAAQAIADDQIDILVDLTGYTSHCRPDILAARPAPLQVNYLGYPGTLASPAIDYILADRVVLPPEHQRWFTEAVAYLPDCYQINDRKRGMGDGSGGRAAYGLPPDGVVFCCFNDLRKITPAMFAVWMGILKRTPGAVLWLLAGKDTARVNLRREAADAGVAPDRLVFAAPAPHETHLARYRCADLFLDTQPYTAHTTASDALWCGCPVLTVIGQSFPGRVAASLLQAVGLPDLAVGSLAEYEDLAVRLAVTPALRAAFRKKLQDSRATCALFDSPRQTRHLEQAYAEMWRRHENGLKPQSFGVSGRVDIR